MLNINLENCSAIELVYLYICMFLEAAVHLVAFSGAKYILNKTF